MLGIYYRVFHIGAVYNCVVSLELRFWVFGVIRKRWVIARVMLAAYEVGNFFPNLMEKLVSCVGWIELCARGEFPVEAKANVSVVYPLSLGIQ